MSAPDLKRLRELLTAALHLSEELRPAFVRASTTGNHELERELLALLRDVDVDDPRFEPLADLSLAVGAVELAQGQRLGPWELRAHLGRGGMGDVWLAERADGAYVQRVAIKLPRAGLGGPGAYARFERERSLLAELELPGVARLVDGGWTEPGRPWFAMEYVEGAAIDAHAREHALGTRARARLVLEAARVLAAAHRRRIVHRDLKPSNVLVRADGSVVLVDFGIAAALGEDRSARGSWLATPRYASPEQLRGEATTTASDVYSLALLARELLGEVDGDLRAILAAALEADPERRTSSADAFASDLERWLGFEPVAARPPGPWHRARLFARRNPIGAVVSLALVLTVAAALVLTTHLWRAERAERLRTAAANDALALRFAQVRILVGELVFGVHDRVGTLPGAVPVRAFLMQRAEAHLEDLVREGPLDAELAREIVEVHLRVADVRGARGRGNLGDMEGALRSADRARDIVATWAQRDPADVGWCELEARTRRLMGDLLRSRGEREAADAEYVAAHAAVLRGLAHSPEELALSRLAAIIELQRGKLDLARGDIAHGTARLRSAREALDRLIERHAGSGVIVRDLLLVLSQEAFALAQTGRDGEAAELWARALELQDELVGGSAADPQAARDRVILTLEQALSHALSGGGAAAVRAFDAALSEARDQVRDDGGNLLARRTLEQALLMGARLAQAEGELEQAVDRYREAESLLRATRELVGDDRDLLLDLAGCLAGRAHAERSLGLAEGVEPAFLEALEILDPPLALARGEHLAGNFATMAWIGLASLPLAAGDALEARSRFERYHGDMLAWAERFAELAWPPRHLGAFEYGLGSAAEALGVDASRERKERVAHLEVAREAFERGLAIALGLEAEGRFAPHEAELPGLFAADVERVAALLSAAE